MEASLPRRDWRHTALTHKTILAKMLTTTTILAKVPTTMAAKMLTTMAANMLTKMAAMMTA